jgi:hypothetical protein
MFVIAGNFPCGAPGSRFESLSSIRTATMKYQGEGLAHLMQRCYLQTVKKCSMADEIKVQQIISILMLEGSYYR